jgi:hypothetical protein
MNTTIGEAVDKKLPSAGPSFQRGHQRERGKGGFLQSSKIAMLEPITGFEKHLHAVRAKHYIFWFIAYPFTLKVLDRVLALCRFLSCLTLPACTWPLSTALLYTYIPSVGAL